MLKRPIPLFVPIVAAILILLLAVPAFAQDGPRAFLGVSLQGTDSGAEIVEVVPNSPAEDAGLQVGDVITGWDGEPINVETPLTFYISQQAPGDEVELTVDRDGETLSLTVTLTIHPDDADQPAPDVEESANMVRGQRVRLGGMDTLLTPRMWLVYNVPEDSDYLGVLFPGDRISALDGTSTGGLGFAGLLTLIGDGGDFEAAIVRGGEEITLTLNIPSGGIDVMEMTAVDVDALDAAAVEAMAAAVDEDAPVDEAAVPADDADAAEAEAAAGPPYVGVTIQNTPEGAVVVEVVPGSPAEAAGLQVDDVIVAVDGAPIDAENLLPPVILARSAGDALTLTVERDGEQQEVALVLGSQPDEAAADTGEDAADDADTAEDAAASDSTDEAADEAADADAETGDAAEDTAADSADEATDEAADADAETAADSTDEAADSDEAAQPAEPEDPNAPAGFLGVSFVTMTQAIADEIGITFAEGALVAEVLEGTPAAEIGLVQGVLIVAVNGEPLNQEISLADRLYAYEAGDTVTLTLAGVDGESLDVDVILAERPPELDAPAAGEAGDAAAGEDAGEPEQAPAIEEPTVIAPGEGSVVVPLDGFEGDLIFNGPVTIVIGEDGVTLSPFGEVIIVPPDAGE